MSQPPNDKYPADCLRDSFAFFKQNHYNVCALIDKTGARIRLPNPPEDMTENMAKFIIRNYDNDPSCCWGKGMGVKGDLCSLAYKQPEVKSFTSDGPMQFSPSSHFDVLYCLDLRKWKQDNFVLWRVNLTDESPEFKNVKVNKKQTLEEQCAEGRRPHIGWDKLHCQLDEHCVKVFEGTFDDILIPPSLVQSTPEDVER
jgi:hypothetical protein